MQTQSKKKREEKTLNINSKTLESEQECTNEWKDNKSERLAQFGSLAINDYRLSIKDS